MAERRDRPVGRPPLRAPLWTLLLNRIHGSLLGMYPRIGRESEVARHGLLLQGASRTLLTSRGSGLPPPASPFLLEGKIEFVGGTGRGRPSSPPAVSERRLNGAPSREHRPRRASTLLPCSVQTAHHRLRLRQARQGRRLRRATAALRLWQRFPSVHR